MKKLLFILLCTELLLGKGSIAISMKVIGDVKVKKDTLEAVSLKPGNALSDRDLVFTGQNGFVAILYLDDHTTIKVRENTELRIGGLKTSNGLNKTVDVSYGKLIAKVTDQRGKEFMVSTPTSVASVKGTEFFVNSGSDGDTYTVLEGLISVQNTITGQLVDVGSRQTVESVSDQPMEVTESTVEELAEAEMADPDAGPETVIHELKVEFEDQNGNIKTIVITYE